MTAEARIAFAGFLLNTKFSNSVPRSPGSPARIFTIRTIEIPLPTPFFFISSPITIHKTEPLIIQTIANIPFIQFISWKMPDFVKPMTMAALSTTASPSAVHRFTHSIFLRPYSPSFCISSNFGMTIVRS